jgi:hypothetical protein
MFMAQSISLTRMRDPRNRTRLVESMWVEIPAFIEPRIHVVATSTIRPKTITDEHGHSLMKPPDQNIGWMDSLWNAEPLANDIPLNCPPEMGTKIAVFKGDFNVRVVSALKTVEIPWDLEHITLLNVAGIRCAIESVNGPTGPWGSQDTTTITLSRGDVPADAWPERKKLLSSGTAVVILDREGHVLQQSRTPGSKDQDDKVVVTAHAYSDIAEDQTIAPTKPPARIVIDVPLASKQLTIPVEFHDLPLPR